jgi:altered-inheritance-of-mitochondria protein 5
LARKAHETRWEDVRDATAESWRGIMNLVKKE